MTKFPSLKFIINSHKDFEMLEGFLKTAKFFDMEKDLAMGFYDTYPELKEIIKSKDNQKQKNKLIKNFIKKIYRRYSNQIRKSINEAKRQWQQIKKVFFKEVSVLFKNYPWPQGEYIAYPTIWGIYPRFIKNKSFFFPYDCKNKNFISFVIMHEMLHFIFYDYAIKKHPKIFRKLDTERGIFWDLAEIFNSIILSEPEFKKLHKQKRDWSYPAHRKYIPKLKKYWQDSRDIDIWIEKAFKYFKTKKIR